MNWLRRYRNSWACVPPWAEELKYRLARIIANQEIIMSVQQDIKDQLDRLTADVAAETTLVGGLTVFIKGLKDKIQELADATKDTTTAQALQALATQIEVNNKAVADAVTENTETPPVNTEPSNEPAPFPNP